MHKRFPFIVVVILLFFSLAVPVLASSAGPSVSADDAQKMLIEGNKRFVSDKNVTPDITLPRRTELAKGQHPFAVIVSCSDSRVPPEHVFNQGLGNLFVVRVAGNVLDAIELGSVEYAVEHLGAKLIVVMGHEKCGAVKAAVDGSEVPPNIQAIAAKIQPAVAAAKAKHADNVYEEAADLNVGNMVDVLKHDPVIEHIKGIKIVGAKYHLESGQVDFIK